MWWLRCWSQKLFSPCFCHFPLIAIVFSFISFCFLFLPTFAVFLLIAICYFIFLMQTCAFMGTHADMWEGERTIECIKMFNIFFNYILFLFCCHFHFPYIFPYQVLQKKEKIIHCNIYVSSIIPQIQILLWICFLQFFVSFGKKPYWFCAN